MLLCGLYWYGLIGRLFETGCLLVGSIFLYAGDSGLAPLAPEPGFLLFTSDLIGLAELGLLALLFGLIIGSLL